MDLASYSLERLQQLSNDIEKEMQNRRVSEEANFLDEIRRKAAALNIDFDTLAKKLQKQGKGGSGVPTKFRHPETGAEWSGRGRKPQWAIEWIQSGRSLDELTVGR